MTSSLFLRRLIPKPVPNAGSELRDHQANERTFLSWTRMGLAFAAMALALGRLDIIDQIFHQHTSNGSSQTTQHFVAKTTGANEDQNQNQNQNHETRFHPRSSNELIASRICQGISIWSFGYGFLRYMSVRQHLLHGRYIPAIWGPALMTCGSLCVFGTTIQVDWRVPTSFLWQEKRDGHPL